MRTHILKYTNKKNLNPDELIYGVHTVSAFIKKNIDCIKTIYLSSRSTNFSKLDKDISNFKNIIYLEKKELDKLTSNAVHQGIVAEIDFNFYKKEDELYLHLSQKKNAIFLILDSIKDPRNLGACLRNALAFNVDAVIVNKDGSAPINSHVLKSSVGAVLDLDIFQVVNLNRVINKLQSNGFWIVGLDGNSETSIFDETFNDRTAFVMGSEGTGIRKLIKKNCDSLIKIPTNKSLDSLNISVASGIVLFEIHRRNLNI